MWAAAVAFAAFNLGALVLLVGEPSTLRWGTGVVVIAVSVLVLRKIRKELERLPRQHR